MSDYALSEEAEQDLQAIARYTVETWGEVQARRYAVTLHNHFEALGRDDIVTRGIFDEWAELRMSRCEHHFVFSVSRTNGGIPLILAVLHEQMDLIARLQERLEGWADE